MKPIPLFVAFILLISSNAWCDRVTSWQQDLDTYAQEMKNRHISPFTQISETEFDKALVDLRAGVSEKTDLQIIIGLMALTRKIGDGHTAVQFQRHQSLNVFPVEVFDDSGAWIISATTGPLKKWLGAEITHIDGIKIKQIKKALSGVAQFVENEHSLQQRTSQYVRYSALLHAMGLTENPDSAVFTLSLNGSKATVTLDAVYPSPALVHAALETPKVTRIQDAGIDSLWFGSPERKDTVYIKFAGYPSFDQMAAFGQQLLEYINKQGVKNAIIDLRGNWGGDFYVGLWMAYFLNLADGIDWEKGVYTLIDNDTFSAATINATQYKQLLNAKVVGEPTGSNPRGFQDMDTFELPHSTLVVSYSKRLFRLQAKPAAGLEPDVEIKNTWRDISAGNDAVLAWVLKALAE